MGTKDKLKAFRINFVHALCFRFYLQHTNKSRKMTHFTPPEIWKRQSVLLCIHNRRFNTKISVFALSPD